MSTLKRLNLECYPSFITTKTIDNYPFFSSPKNAEIVISTLYFWFFRESCGYKESLSLEGRGEGEGYR